MGTRTFFQSALAALLLTASVSGIGQTYDGDTSTLANPIVKPAEITRYLLTETIQATGCSNSKSVEIGIDPLPGTAGAIAGTATVVQGQSGVVYSVEAVPKATGYFWTLPAGASITSGDNSSEITVSFSGAATSGNITVKGTNGCGTGSTSPAFSVTVLPAIPPYIYITGVVISSGQSVCYNATQTVTVGGVQAFKVNAGGSAELAAGANVALTPKTVVESGAHVVAHVVQAGGSCGPQKESFIASTTGNRDPEAARGEAIFRAWPNPTTGRITIAFNAEVATETIHMQIFSMQGILIREDSFTGIKEKQLSLENCPPGLYFIRVTAGDRVLSVKIIRE